VPSRIIKLDNVEARLNVAQLTGYGQRLLSLSYQCRYPDSTVNAHQINYQQL
jgi:hypothetical protein